MIVDAQKVNANVLPTVIVGVTTRKVGRIGHKMVKRRKRWAVCDYGDRIR